MGGDGGGHAEALAAAVALRKGGAYREALPALEEVLRRAGWAGPEGEAEARHELGVALNLQSRYAEATAMHGEALRLRTEALGARHADTGDSLLALGAVLQEEGKFVEARPWMERALAVHREALGEAHPRTADTTQNLAGLLEDLGELDESLVLYRQAVRALRAALAEAEAGAGGAGEGEDEGEDEASEAHRHDVALYLSSALFGLAWLHLRRVENDEGLECFEETLRIRRAELGADHPKVASALSGIGSLRRMRGEFKASLEAQLEAMRIRRLAVGDRHVTIAIALHNAGNVHLSLGNASEAFRCYLEALDIKQEALSPLHPSLALTYACLGNYYRRAPRRDFLRAHEAYREAHRIRHATLGPEHRLTVDALAQCHNTEVFAQMESFRDRWKVKDG